MQSRLRERVRVAVAVLSVVVIPSGLDPAMTVPSRGVVTRVSNAEIVEPASADWAAGAQRSIAAREYEVTASTAGLQGPNRAQGLRTYFEASGARVVDREDDATALVQIRTVAIGRRGSTCLVAPGDVVADGARVEVLRAGFVEWYENSQRGLEHGYTISERFDGDRPLTIEVDLGGPLLTVGDDLATIAAAGGRRLEYGGLAAFDAAGTPVPVHMEAAAETSRVRLVVDDSNATYPITVDPMLTQPAFTTLLGDETSAGMGYSVAGAGDVNNDGYDDIIVGAPTYDSGETDEGAAFVYLGGPNGIASGGPAGAGARLESNQSGAQLGFSVSGAGDVNNDGYDDVIVGALYYDSGETDEGAAFVFLGGPTGIVNGNPATAATTLQSNQAFAYFGYPVASAGDVNDDHFADVIVGAFTFDLGEVNEGAAFVFLGSASGIATGNPTTANSVLQSNQENSQFGLSVAGTGDTNGDGYDDIMVGAPGYYSLSLEEGGAFEFLGGPDGIPNGSPSSTAAAIHGSQEGAHLGISVAGAGDVNNDGFDDVVVGASDSDIGQTDTGLALVFNGGPEGIGDDTVTHPEGSVYSEQENAKLGSSVAGAGDVNGDGYDDVIVGSYIFDNEQYNEGVAVLILGGPAGVPVVSTVSTAPVVLQPDQEQAWFGVDVAGAGDVNGDGHDDIVVGASNYDAGQTDGGAAFVYLGSRDGLNGFNIPSASIESNQPGAIMGGSVAGAGDVNNDGYDDIIVGANWYDSGKANAGAAFVFHGGPAGIGNSSAMNADAILQADQADSFFGISVAGAGDTNGDGYADVIIGAGGYDSGQTDEGAAFVFLGGPNGIGNGSPTNADAILQGDQADGSFGSVAGAGDVNNDGYDDVIVGAVSYDMGQLDEGAAFVFHGGPGGIGNGNPSNADAILQSDQVNAGMGGSVAGAGDTNGDGFDDVIVGAALYDSGELDEGAAFVFHGGPDGVGSRSVSNADAILEANSGVALMGACVAAAGDVNNDGYDDVVVGSYRFTSEFGSAGAAFVFLGGPGGVGNGNPANADTIIGGDAVSSRLGVTVAGAGDVNGDGFDDIVVTSSSANSSRNPALVFLGGTMGIPSGHPRDAAATLGGFTAGFMDAEGAGDVDGDGFDDIVVGANRYSNGQLDEGAAFVYNLQRPEAPPSGSDTAGVYIPSTGAWFLRNTNSAGGADSVFTYGAGGAGLVPIHGDWDGDGDDTPGLYSPATGAFFLRNSTAPGGADIVFNFGAGGAGYLPLAGDWNGDGTDTVGLYQPVTGTFFLRNANSSGAADLAFGYGPGSPGWKPLVGDWNGDGTDTVGLFEPMNSNFYLKNTNGSGVADVVFGFGPAGAGWEALSGDFDGNGADTVGLYNPTNGFFFLQNQNTPGVADINFEYGPANAMPLVGDWNGS